MIKSGERFPSLDVRLVDTEGVRTVDSHDLVASGLTIAISLPGAFTPTCHNAHLPGYVRHRDEFAPLGVDRIICLSVNDHHVLGAWARETGALGKVDFVADFDATLAKALGLERDMSATGLGLRFRRSAMIIRDGVLEQIFVQDTPGQTGATDASIVLAALRTQT